MNQPNPQAIDAKFRVVYTPPHLRRRFVLARSWDRFETFVVPLFAIPILLWAFLLPH